MLVWQVKLFTNNRRTSVLGRDMMQEIIAGVLSGALANAGRGKGDHWLTVCHSGTSQSRWVLTASCAPDTVAQGQRSTVACS